MRIFATLLCLLALIVPALAQSNYAVVTGTVTDSQSLPVVGATVHFTAMSTGAIRVLTTNDRGLFSAPALSPDDYELTTE
ncbi:MAG TPA: carboxypeptidase-like regulatory domain-containing protein, partial [Terriglobales bacterium]|nr:carboxypeptidase-like regulatory domain-containing protein [Terriglobales bacterium]